MKYARKFNQFVRVILWKCKCQRRGKYAYFKVTNPVALQHDGSSPHSQQPISGPCPDRVDSTPYPSVNLSTIHSDPIRSSMPQSSEWSIFFGLSHRNLVHFSLLSHACHMPQLPHFPWLDLPNDTKGWVQNMKLLTVQLPSFSCYFWKLLCVYINIWNGNLYWGILESIKGKARIYR
jgi:hypothetical protein